MSNTIDERVVEMRFDNKNFESNVATSMSTLEKLKQKLNLTGATKGLEEINAAAGKVNMNGIESGIESVKAKFSALDVVAVTALANITNKAIDAGEKLVKSLSIDQITAGWQKFSDMTVSSATLVAQGYSIEEVNKQLDNLLYFTDETSYNFTEMVSNISKFTATGKNLEESVTAMEGIANWAALSGQNATTASRAMYQLSQAMGAGVMRLEDYKSIQNASMDTEEFRQKCIEAAVSLGTLKDNGNGTYSSLIEGANDASFSISQFTSQLTYGKWLTSDVMMEVFNTYSSAVGAILDRADETGSLVSEIIDEIHSKADELKTDTMSDTEAIDAAIRELGYTLDDGSLMFDSFGLKALEAAQKARTFSDAIASVKDAVSSQWMKTFQLIFGDANQATELWTDVANQLWDIFAGGGESRNELLEGVMVSGWDKLIERINDAGIETSEYEQALRKCAEAGGVDISGLIKEYGSLSEVFKNGALSTDYLKKAFNELQTSVTKTTNLLSVDLDTIERQLGFGSYGEDVKKVQTALEELGFSLDKFGVDGIIGAETTQAIKDFQESVGLVADGIVDSETIEALKKAGTLIEEIGDASEKADVPIDDLLNSITRPSGRELIFDTISNSLTAVSKVVETFREAWSDIFTDTRVANGLYNALSTVQKASEKLVNFLDTKADKLKSTFKGVIAIIDILSSVVSGGLSAAFEILGEIFGSTDTSILDITGSIGDAIVWFRDWLEETQLISKAFSKLVAAAKKVIDIIKRWINAFANIPFVSDILENIRQLFSDISSDVNDGTDNVEKWVGAFDGLSVVNKILEKVGDAFEWIGGVVEDAITAIGPWFEVFKETEGVQQLVGAVTDLASALEQLFNGEIDANEFASVLGGSLADVLQSLPKMAIQCGKDFIAGFTNGLSEGIGEVISNILEFCSNFISAFLDGLGERSPSVIAHEAGVNWVQGFINGISAMLGPLMAAVQPIIDFITGVFKSFWGYITDENGEIEWDKIFAGAITIEALAIALKFAEAFQTLANAMTSFSGIFSSIKSVFSSLSTAIKDIGKAAKWDLTASAVMKMAIAVGILAAAIFVLAKIDDVGKLWNAVGVIVVLAAVVAALAWVMSKLGDASIQFSLAEKKLDVNGMKTTILQLGVAMLLLAAAVKIIGSMDADEAKQGLISLAGMIGGLIVFMAAMGGISRYSKDLSGFSSMMTKMAIAMLLMVVVIKMVGKLDESEIRKGIAFMGAFAIFTAAIGLVAALCGEHVSKFGSMMIKLAIAMGLMVIVCKMVNKLSAEEALKGAAFAAAFVIFVAALVKVTTIGSEQKLAEVGGVVLATGAAILLMAAACKLVSTLSWDEIAKGLTCVVTFGLVLAALISLLKIGNEQQMGKVAGSLVGASVAILIMAGTAVILSMIPIEDLAKGVAVVALFGVIMAGMIYSLRGANEAQKSIKAMAVCIALMAAAVVALSFLDPADLARCTAAMVILMGTFALMAKTMKSIGKLKIGPLIVLSGIILVLAGVITIMTNVMKDSTAAIAAAGSLSMVILAFAAAFKILDGVRINKTVADNLLLMSGCMVILGVVLAVMSALPHASSMIENAISLGILINCLAVAFRILNGVKLSTTVTKNLLLMSGCMAILGVVLAVMSAFPQASSMIENAVSLGILINCLASAMLILNSVKNVDGIEKKILALTAMAIPLLAFGIVLRQMNGIENAMSNVLALTALMTAMTVLLAAVSLIGQYLSSGIIAGIASLTAMAIPMVVFIEVLKQMDGIEDASGKIESLTSMMTTMTLLLAALAIVGLGGPAAIIGIGSLVALFVAIGTLAVGIGALMDKFPSIQKFLDTGLPVLEQLAGSLGAMVGNFISGIGEALSGTLVKMGEDIAEFMNQLAIASDNASGIKGESFDGVKQLMDVMSDMALTTVGTTIGDIFTLGGTSMEKFQKDGVAFFEAMKAIGEASSNVNIDEESMESVIGTAQKLADLQSSLEPIGGVISWFTGRDDLATFGVNVGQFIGSMILAFGALDNVDLDTDAMDSIVSAATSLSDLQSSLEPIGGVITWFTGRDDLGTFGANVGSFVSSMVVAFASLTDVEFNTEAMDSIISAATSLAGLQSSLEPIGGVISWFTGRDDLGTFGVNVGQFVGSMKTALDTLEGTTLNEEALTSVITAAQKLSDLQSKLEPMGGVISWFSGRTDLGTFGTNIGLFADAMGKLKTGMGENGISEVVIASVTNAGNAIIALQEALPEESWFDGKMNLSEFSDYVTDFATAMSTFGTKAAEIDTGAVSTVISTAYRIKSLIETLVDLDTSGVDAFTGIGSGGFGADGPAYDIACAIAKFGEKVADINTEAVSVAVTAARQLKTLIAGLVGLDTSGIENFKPEAIGTQIKTYAEKVGGIDTAVVSSSITSANRLKTFIAGLVGLDTSGISKFNISSIGSSLSAYSANVAGFDSGIVGESVTAGNKLKNFITSLAGLDTSGVSSFKTAINELSTVNISAVVEAFSGASTQLFSAGTDMVNNLVRGMESGTSSVEAAGNTMATAATKAVETKSSAFSKAGATLAKNLATGISSQKDAVTSATTSCVSGASSVIRGYYSSFYSAGSYLVTGLCNGISDNSYRAAAKAAAMANAAAEAAKAALDINSPSKVFKKIGSGIPEGFALGITMLGSEVKHSVIGMTSTAIDTTRSAMTTVLDALNSDMDAQPTIRPVIDLTDVKAGANNISDLLSTKNTVGVMANIGAVSTMMNNRRQNGDATEVVSAINKLRKDLGNVGNTTYTVGNITYDDGSNVSRAVESLVRAARTERRV